MEAVIDSLVNRVAQIVEENLSLILGIKDQVDDLVNELKAFNAYLSEASRNESSKDNALFKDVVLKIQRIANEAEDAIDKYVVERRNHKAKPRFVRWVEKANYYSKVNDAAKEIEGIRKRAQKIHEDQSNILNLLRGTASQPAPVLKAPVVEEDDVVGFDGEAIVIKERLTKNSDELTVISIVGMAGLGKTTLTKKVFNDRELNYESFTRLWVYVSKSMDRKQIFLNIINTFTKQTDGYKNMSEEQLAETIKGFLKGGRYLVVMDDVWSKKDWEYLKIAFPKNQKGSRILVTTRNHEVARHVDSNGDPHKLKFLGAEESWELLRKKVFRKETCPANLVPIGKSIAKKCNGLPLAVVVIAGVLNKESTFKEWKKVNEDPFPVINQQNQSYYELVKLSYDRLPNSHTKDCFLYLAAFPIGHEICAWKLIRLWIAEGFIPLSFNLEGTAETVLKDIVDRNLLMVLKRRADGEIKICRLHDTLHEFCKSEALNKNLFHEMYGGTKIETNDGYRRLCLRSSPKDFIGSEEKPSGEHIRSFLTSTKLEIPKEHLSILPKSYPLLKVFDVEAFKFQVLPKELYQLYHLRYLAVSTDLHILPKTFSNLWNMQTLVFNTSKSSVAV